MASEPFPPAQLYPLLTLFEPVDITAAAVGLLLWIASRLLIHFGRECNPKRLQILLWLLFMVFITNFYTTLLQIRQIVPETRFSDLSIDDVTRENFTLLSSSSAYIGQIGKKSEELLRRATIAGSLIKKAEILQKEVLVGEKVKPAPFDLGDKDIGLRLLKMSSKHRKAFLTANNYIACETSIIKALGKDAIVGKDQLLPAAD